METNEKLKIALLQETEKELLTMIEHFETIPEGDLQMLEQSVLRACLALGRTMLEQILTHSGEEAERPSRRQGECGQKPRLVGLRPKQIHTLMGKVTIRRAYYQCLVEEKEPRTSCSHGQAPWDSVWGLIAGRTSPGVQKQLGKLVSRLTLAEAVDTFTSLLPLPMSERQALKPSPTARRHVARAGRKAGCIPLLRSSAQRDAHIRAKRGSWSIHQGLVY